MSNHYDARSPAQGVRVLPVPRQRAQGLSLAQAKGLRIKPSDFDGASSNPWVGEGVFRQVAEVRPVKTNGGGLPSPAVMKNAKVVEGRIGARLERGLPRTGKAPVNLICKKRLPKASHYEQIAVTRKLKELQRLMHQIGSVNGNPQAEENYERARASFLKLHENHRRTLFAMEIVLRRGR